ncbi:MAG: hypothetical protein K2M31_05840 [Muribaculaceae bacterium]|nr:hypothetical protein [Muribaculaceae bacterium]
MNLLKYSLATALIFMAANQLQAANYAWPERFEGVMLQGFYWDSYQGTNNTKWTTLTAMSDELSKNFKVIWVPNSGKAASNPGMGYDPVYWFTNHNSSFGTETQLRTMISTFKAKGTDIIEDVVINHRSGVSNWTNFPAETWNGVTYKLGPEHICRNDEVAWATGQATPTGDYDTGDNFDGSRDLDHKSVEVQNNCKNYCKFLLEDLGYAGFRYDMVKGYAGWANKIYNEYSKPKYSVGEYWDGQYDAVAAWIESTGKQSAAFDFPCKYAINEAFHSGDLRKLVWKENGTTDQPAGLIHHWYQQYAVTFIDNHDTYRDGSKFNGNVVAANAFILCSPGTPCVFWQHYVQNKAEIQQLIAVRNACGIHNQSPVKVLKSASNCYMAEVTGTKGKLVVKIGSDMSSPSGYSNSDIKASGKEYCVWTKIGVTRPDDPIVTPTYPANLYLIGNLNGYNWASAHGVAQSSKNDGVYVWKDVTFSDSSDGYSYFSFLTQLDPKDGAWTAANQGDRYGATLNDKEITVTKNDQIRKFIGNADAGSCYAWKILPGKYSITADLSKMEIQLKASTTEIDMVETEDAEPVYYNLQGQKVENPEKGIYIVVRGNRTTKEIIR